MKEKKFPLPGEVLSENHQFRTSKPPIHGFSILARREKRNKKPPRGSKRQSLRIGNSEPPDPLVTNSRFSRGEENKKPPRHSKITQSPRIGNSEPSALSSVNSRFSRGEEREAKSVQNAPEATPLVRVVHSVVWWCVIKTDTARQSARPRIYIMYKREGKRKRICVLFFLISE